MKQSSGKKRFLLLLILAVLTAAPLFSWDEGYLSLTVPVKTDGTLTVEPELSVRMLDVIPPDRAAFRISDGVVILDSMRATVSYLTNRRELSAEFSGWLPVGPFFIGAAVEGIWADDLVTPDSRYWSGAATVFGWGWIVPSLLNVALNMQYDLYFERLNAGLGLSVSVIPDTLSIVAEGLFSPLNEFAWAWQAGVLIKTAGHQFLLYVGNGNDMRMRNILAAAPDPGALAFGITVRRKIEILYKQ
jgi:hypothetical protein